MGQWAFPRVMKEKTDTLHVLGRREGGLVSTMKQGKSIRSWERASSRGTRSAHPRTVMTRCPCFRLRIKAGVKSGFKKKSTRVKSCGLPGRASSGSLGRRFEGSGLSSRNSIPLHSGPYRGWGRGLRRVSRVDAPTHLVEGPVGAPHLDGQSGLHIPP